MKRGWWLYIVLWQGVAKIPRLLHQRQAILTNPLSQASLFRSSTWLIFWHIASIDKLGRNFFVIHVKRKKFMNGCHHGATIPGKVRNQNSPPLPLEQPFGCHAGAWPISGVQYCLCWRVGNIDYYLILWIMNKGGETLRLLSFLWVLGPSHCDQKNQSAV